MDLFHESYPHPINKALLRVGTLDSHKTNAEITGWPLVGNEGPSTFTACYSLGMKLPENSLRVGPARLGDCPILEGKKKPPFPSFTSALGPGEPMIKAPTTWRCKSVGLMVTKPVFWKGLEETTGL